MWIAIFGAIVLVRFGYVHHATSSYLASRFGRAIATQHMALQRACDTGGRSGLVSAIEQSIAEQRFEGGLYLLAHPSSTPVAGNLRMWFPTLRASVSSLTSAS
jgi:hypothetical protein